MTNKEITQLTERHVAGTYGRYPIALVKGKGMYVWDASGKKYLDFVAGVAVDSLGHCPPAVVRAIRKQAGQLLHVSNWFHIEPQARLAAEITRLSFGDKVFFCNSGTEATEGAIKLARKFFVDQGQKSKTEIITTYKSFHGRTLGAMSATPQDKIQKGFGPLVPGFKYVPFDDIAAMKKAITSKTCAVMVEPIQGESGVNIPSKTYIKELRKLCTKQNVLLILDEIQTGFGRTGHLFAYQGFGAKPDIMTLAKGLGAGVPIGALVMTNNVAKALGPGTHGSTFGGNPLVCAAALASVDIVSDKLFLRNVQNMGKYFLSRLKELAKKLPVIKEVRGMGLILAIDIDGSSAEVAKDCMEQGILVNSIQPGTLRFIPPLIVTQKNIDTLIRALTKSLTQLS
ncbi:MAG: aspartate aminotransferase family protein [Nitrospinota bacterium]|nr:aspartate aminotransferase family protein [Nitrospinota bacterium]